MSTILAVVHLFKTEKKKTFRNKTGNLPNFLYTKFSTKILREYYMALSWDSMSCALSLIYLLTFVTKKKN
jgi:hypothetical protein